MRINIDAIKEDKIMIVIMLISLLITIKEINTTFGFKKAN